MIKIITGHSSYGGSTTAFINLTNLFNKNGIQCKLYGPHDWHLTKCNADRLDNFRPEADDRVIVHFLRPATRIPSKVVVLSVHEQNVFPLSTVNLDVFDKIQFVAQHQMEYHGAINKEHFIIPNVMDDLKRNPKLNSKVAGIIGTIDPNKNVHISIANAIKMGFTDIRIFGNIGDPGYYQMKVAPYLQAYSFVKHVGFCEDKQSMYDSITDVFFSSERECLPYVIGECRMTGTNLHTLKGKNYVNGSYELDNEKILSLWKEKLEL